MEEILRLELRIWRYFRLYTALVASLQDNEVEVVVTPPLNVWNRVLQVAYFWLYQTD